MTKSVSRLAWFTAVEQLADPSSMESGKDMQLDEEAIILLIDVHRI